MLGEVYHKTQSTVDNNMSKAGVHFHRFTDGREVAFLYHLANLWQLFTIEV
jgi:hypothetical protein